MSDQDPVIVVGAGIVGTAAARALQRAGHTVTLLDSAEPGRATSLLAWLETEAIFHDHDALYHLSPKGFVTSFHVGEVQVGEHI